MMTPEDFENWKRDIEIADGTHPNQFANGPFMRASFRITQEASSVGQQIAHLALAVDNVNLQMEALNKGLDKAAKSSNFYSKAIIGLTIILAIAAIIQAFAAYRMSKNELNQSEVQLKVEQG